MMYEPWEEKLFKYLDEDSSNVHKRVSKIIEEYNLAMPFERVRSRARRYLTKGRLIESRDDNSEKTEQPITTENYKETHEYKDGVYTHDRLIEIMEGETITPESIMKAHGIDSALWQVLSYKNNRWHMQSKEAGRIIMYQSKVVVKPTENEITFKNIDAYFQNKAFDGNKITTCPINYDARGEIIEICVPDLHSGLLSWREETGEDYDIKIMNERFNMCFSDITSRLHEKKIKKIYFITLGDLLHVDNDQQTTTKGTFQQIDGRTGKIYDKTLDLLIATLTTLGDLAPVEVVYLAGNHDRVTGRMLIKSLEMAFRNDINITFDVSPNPQKSRSFGKILIGWTHGDLPKKNMTNWIQPIIWKLGKVVKFVEIHSGHYHTENVKEFNQTDDLGGIIVRYLPNISSSSYWEHQQGYVKSVKTMLTYIWDENIGLRDIWYSNI